MQEYVKQCNSPPRRVFERALTGKYLPILGEVRDVFEALAAPARRAILDELHQRNGQTLLESAGLITTERQGKYKHHYLDTAPLRPIVERWSLSR